MSRGTPISPQQQQIPSSLNQQQQHQPSVLENLINSPNYDSSAPSLRYLNGFGDQNVGDSPFGNTMQQNDEVSYINYMWSGEILSNIFPNLSYQLKCFFFDILFFF